MSSASTSIDVAVIGGGPAGAAAARLLVSWGHRVTLFSRPSAPHALAESLPPSCAKLFDRLGIRDQIDRAGFVRATGNTVYWGAESERVERFPDSTFGYQVIRDTFDALLRRAAIAAGAQLCQATVRAIERRSAEKAWDVAYEIHKEAHSIEARWILDCTGRTGLIARRGWRRPEPGGRTMALIGVWERADGWDLADETHTLVESYEGGSDDTSRPWWTRRSPQCPAVESSQTRTRSSSRVRDACAAS